jgi:hypothetical protein
MAVKRIVKYVAALAPTAALLTGLMGVGLAPAATAATDLPSATIERTTFDAQLIVASDSELSPGVVQRSFATSGALVRPLNSMGTQDIEVTYTLERVTYEESWTPVLSWTKTAYAVAGESQVDMLPHVFNETERHLGWALYRIVIDVEWRLAGTDVVLGSGRIVPDVASDARCATTHSTCTSTQDGTILSLVSR